MNKNNKVVASTADTSTLVRAKFGPGMLLQHEDLEQLNAYTRELSRLLFRSFFGCGVVCGLVVKPEVDRCNKVFVTVDAGLALDCSGDPVYVPKVQHIALDENCAPDIKGPFWVVLCGTTKNCAPRTSTCTDDDDQAMSACTRERDMFEIQVVSERPKCACGCDESKYPSPTGQANDYCWCTDPLPDCHTSYYAGECGCNCGDDPDCGCKCILLARLDKDLKSNGWTVDHRVRRFIRPVLMRDPEVRPPQQSQDDAKREAQYHSDMAAAKDDLAVALKDASAATETLDKLAVEARSAAMARAEKSLVASMAENKYTEAQAAMESAKPGAEKKRAETALNEARLAVASAKEEEMNAITQASASEAAWQNAVQEKRARDQAVSVATDRVSALAEALSASVRNGTTPPAADRLKNLEARLNKA
jgi:hypothetical protein